MDSLNILGALLLAGGLLIFGLKLLAYNRRKYQIRESHNDRYPEPYQPRQVTRLLALVLFVIALLILYLFRE